MSIFISRWKKIARKVTSFQADILFSIIFFLLILPIGFLARKSLEKKLRLKLSKKRNSYWIKKDDYAQNMVWARKQ